MCTGTTTRIGSKIRMGVGQKTWCSASPVSRWVVPASSATCDKDTAAIALPGIPGGAGLAIAGLRKYEVGSFSALKGKSTPGDQIEIHHAAQKHPAGQAIPGYDPKTGPSIALPRGEHREIPTQKGSYSGSARDLLAKDIKDLRSNTNAPNSSLRELIELNKETYPGAFAK
jgi:hypothetical protein